MKKLALLLVGVLVSMQVMFADSEKPITFEQLPQAAQTFVKKNFPDTKVAFVKQETDFLKKSYDLVFINGDKLEFDSDGNWKEMKCRTLTVPASAIPAGINKFVTENYPDAKVVHIEKDRYEYEVKLSNFWEIKFDLKCNVIDLDRDND